MDTAFILLKAHLHSMTAHTKLDTDGLPTHSCKDKVTEFRANDGCVSSCRFCYSDSIIVTASHDAAIALWDSNDGRKLKVFSGHSDRITGCVADEQNHRLLTSSWDKSVALWDMDSSESNMTWSANQPSLLMSCDLDAVHHVAVAAADDGYYHVWDIRSGQKINAVKGHTNTIMCCRFDFSGMNLCTCSMDHTALVWDVRMWKQLLKLSDHTNVVSCCAFSHNNHWLLTGSWDTNLHLYNVADGRYRANGPVVLSQHHGCISSCDFSKDDSMFVSAGYDSDVNIWCNSTHRLMNSYKGHTNWIKDVHFGENKKWIVSCAKDGAVRVWNTEAGNEVKRKSQSTTTAFSSVKCRKCGDMFTPLTISRPHNLPLNSGECVLCLSRAYLDVPM